jgi:multidrug resistance efflux pump
MTQTPEEIFAAILAEWNTLADDKAAIDIAEQELADLQAQLAAKTAELAAAREEYTRSTDLVQTLFQEVSDIILG